MRITDRVHGLKIPFEVTAPSGVKVPRSVYVYLIFGRRICLVDSGLDRGDSLELDENLQLEVFHTPGHSRGSISLHLPSERVLITGDAVPVPGDIPIYEDIESSVRSIKSLMGLEGIGFLLSSWDEPRQGENIAQAFRASIEFLRRVHESVVEAGDPALPPMEMCRRVLDRMGLPQAAANPPVAASFLSHRKVRDARSLFR